MRSGETGRDSVSHRLSEKKEQLSEETPRLAGHEDICLPAPANPRSEAEGGQNTCSHAAGRASLVTAPLSWHRCRLSKPPALLANEPPCPERKRFALFQAEFCFKSLSERRTVNSSASPAPSPAVGEDCRLRAERRTGIYWRAAIAVSWLTQSISPVPHSALRSAERSPTNTSLNASRAWISRKTPKKFRLREQMPLPRAAQREPGELSTAHEGRLLAP